jgi:putative colanic acid biosynthesis acetyltransferase WcaF
MDRSHSYYPSPHSLANKAGRALWGVVWLMFFRPSPTLLHGWRRFLLRLFGAKLGVGVHVYPSAKVWAPWNLRMDDHSGIGPFVDCYCVDVIRIGRQAAVSQYAFLCTASHDYRYVHLPLVTQPIVIGAYAWIAADVFVGPGVNIGEGAVVGARSSVFKDVQPWCVIAGNPASLIRKREVRSEHP